MKIKQMAERLTSVPVRKKAKRILALTLAVLMVNPVTGHGVTAHAQEAETITAFAKLSSQHQHDDVCGYAEGKPCNFVVAPMVRALVDVADAEASVTDSGGAVTYHDTVEAAVAAAQGMIGSTVTLLKKADTESEVKVTSGTFTIDLNGMTWSSTAGDYSTILSFANGSDVTLKDSGTDGKITSFCDTIVLVNNSLVTIEGGTYENTHRKAVYAFNSSTVSITGGTFKSSENYPAYLGGGKVSISGGSFIGSYKGVFLSTNQNVTLTGGTYSAVEIEINKGSVASLLGNGYGYKSGDTWVRELGVSSLRDVIVQPAPAKITENPEAITIAYAYTTAPTLNVTAEKTAGAIGEISYQWYKGNWNTWNIVPIPGATEPNYTIDTGLALGSYEFYCAVTCDGYTVNSEIATVKVDKSDTIFDGGIKTYKDAEERSIFTYGDIITVTAKPMATGTLIKTFAWWPPEENKMALFVGNTQISGASGPGDNGVYTMTYNTKDKVLVSGSNTITAKYVGTDNMVDFSEDVVVTLNKAALTVNANGSHETNGTNSYTTKFDKAFGLQGVLDSDDVTAIVSGTVPDANIGTDKVFTSETVELRGGGKDFYSLALSDVNYTLTIIDKLPLASVVISETQTVTEIKTQIENALNSAYTVIVTGAKTDVAESLQISIPDRKVVVWKAEFAASSSMTSNLIALSGEGTLEIADEGRVSSDAMLQTYSVYPAINMTGSYSTLIVSGGRVSNTWGSAIGSSGNNNTIVISGGTVENKGEISDLATIDISNATTTLTISGDGIVKNMTLANRSARTINTKGDVTVSDNAKVEIQGDSNSCIYSGGDVNITGGSVYSQDGIAMSASGDSTVNVTGGYVGSGETIAISAVDSNSTVAVSGGIVEGGGFSPTISGGTFITVSGDAIVRNISEQTRATVIQTSGTVKVTGGLVSIPNGIAIYSENKKATVLVSGGIVESSGTGKDFPTIFMSKQVADDDATIGLNVTVCDSGVVRNKGGCAIRTYGSVAVTGGTVIAGRTNAIRCDGIKSSVTVSGGIVFARNKAISNTDNGEDKVINVLNVTNRFDSATDTGMVVSWDYFDITNPTYPTYVEGTTNYILKSPEGATAVWHKEGDIAGIAYKNGSNSGLFPLEVNVIPVPVSDVSLKKENTSIVVGSTETLIATVAPENANNKDITWSSDNTAVATVDASGKVTGVTAGTANITVNTADGNKTATCKVTVGKSGTTFDGGIKTYKGAVATNTFTYGDTITVKAAPKATNTAPRVFSLTPPATDQMALFVGTTQISEPVNADGSGIYSMTYDTTGKALAIGSNTITAKYVGNANMADFSADVSVTLEKKKLTVSANGSISYDGSNYLIPNFSKTFGLQGMIGNDDVNALVQGTVPDANVGDSKVFTGISVEMRGVDKDFYSLALSDINYTVAINKRLLSYATMEIVGEFTYNGTQHKPTVTVTDGNIIKPGDYTVIYGENINAGIGLVTITATESGNYSDSMFQEFTIRKATPTVNLTTDPAYTTYGSPVILFAAILGVNGEKPTGTVTFRENSNTLASNVAVTDGSASYAWENISGGDHSVIVEYTAASDSTGKNYTDVESSTITFNVAKANQSALSIDEVTGQKYGDGEFALSTIGGSGTGDVTYSVPANNGVLSITTGNIATIVGAGTVNVTSTKAGDNNYNSITTTREISIGKAAAPTITFPTASNITYGQKLPASTLTGGSTQHGTFAWTNGNVVPTVANGGYEVTFTPNAGTVANYETITNITKMVVITVSKVTPAVTVSTDISDDAGSRKATLTATVTGAGDGETPTGTVKFVNSTSGSDVDIAGATAVTITGGKVTYTWTGLAKQIYKVKAVYNGSANYNNATSTELSFDTNKQNQEALNIGSIGTKTYGDSVFALSTTGGSGVGAITFESSDPTIVSISGTTVTIHKAGTVILTATKAETDAYNEAITSVSLNVGKKELTVKADDKLNILAGSAMPQLTYSVNGLVGSDTFTKPALTTKDVNANTIGEFAISISGGTLTNADSYTVTYTIGKMTIVRISVADAVVSEITDINYNGNAIVQSGLSVKVNEKMLTYGTDYEVTYKNNTNIGTATVMITGKGIYTGSVEKKFKIKVSKGASYTISNMKYKVTNAKTNGKGTVTLTGSTRSKSGLKGTLKIGDTVTIGGQSFKITAIGDKAFKGYTKLMKVTIGKNVTTIGKEAFSGCSKVTSVTIGTGLKIISTKAFYNCKKLKTITNSSKQLKTVGKDAIKKIYSKAVIKVPSSKVKAYKKLFKSSTGFANGMKIKMK